MDTLRLQEALQIHSLGVTDEALYVIEVAERLEPLLGSRLSAEECEVLTFLLSIFSFRFPDGFIINDSCSTDLFRTLGWSMAAVVASCLSEDKSVKWDHLKIDAASGRPDPALVVDILRRIINDPSFAFSDAHQGIFDVVPPGGS